jgi:predicted nucleic acid-binding protein
VRLALDTNILVYAEGVNGAPMMEKAAELIERLPSDSALLPVQVLGELYQVLVRKTGRTAPEARATILGWRDAFPLIDTSATVMLAAIELATNDQFRIWDAVIVAAAAAADCRLLLSEDLHHGFTWGGTTIVNPFSPQRHQLLDAVLEDPDRPRS